MPDKKIEILYEMIGFKGGDPGFKHLSDVLETGEGMLGEVFSPVQIKKINNIKSIMKEFLAEEIEMNKVSFTAPEDVVKYLRAEYAGMDQEAIGVFFLDTKNKLIKLEMEAPGTVNHSTVYPREIIKKALKYNASGIIIAHNHPSGDPTPSSSDMKLTRTMHQAADTMGIRLVDHIVVGKGGQTYSFQHEGLVETHLSLSKASEKSGAKI